MSDFDDLLSGRPPASSNMSFYTGAGGFGGGFGQDDIDTSNPFAEMDSSVSYLTATSSVFADSDDLYRPPAPEEDDLEPSAPREMVAYDHPHEQEPFDDGVLDYQPPPADTTRFDIPEPNLEDLESFGEHMRVPTPDPIGELMRKGVQPPSDSSSPPTERGPSSSDTTISAHVRRRTSPPPSASPGFRTYDALPAQSRVEPLPKSSPPPLPSVSPPVFQPFGVTATLTSNTSDLDSTDDPLVPSSNRRALPDILGGRDDSLLSGSRGPMPAFKPRSKKNVTVATPLPGKVGEKPEVVQRKLYRPYGIKRIEPKPVIPKTPAPPPPKLAAEPKPPELESTLQPHSAQLSNELTNADQSSPTCDNETRPTPAIGSEPSSADEVVLNSTSTSVTTPPSTSSSPPPSASHVVPTNVDTAPSSASVKTASSITGIASRPSSPRRSSEGADSRPASILDRVAVSPTESTLTTPTRAHQADAAGSQIASRTKEEEDLSEDERPLASVKRDLVEAQLAQRETENGRHAGAAAASESITATHATPSGVNLLEGGNLTLAPAPHPAPPPPPPRYTCCVGDPQKTGSINDVHTVYTVKTQATDPNDGGGPLKPVSTVLRRFRDFSWLFDALNHNNPGVIIPPIPDKNLRSRFQEGFIAARRIALQIFLTKTANHPMLVSDPDLKLFLESDSFTLEVKHRRPDPSMQQSWLGNLGGPRFVEFDDFYDQRRSDLDGLESQLRALHTSLHSACKARLQLAQSVAELSAALTTLSGCDLSKPMRQALERLGSLHQQLQTWGEAQAREEEEGLGATVDAYSRLVGSVRLTFGGRVRSWEKWQLGMQHLRRVQTQYEKNKRAHGGQAVGMQHSLAELTDAERRAHDAKNEFEDVSKLIKVEMQRFDKEKVDDFKAAICNHVAQAHDRQKLIVQAWQDYYALLQNMSRMNVADEQQADGNGAAVPAPTVTEAGDE